MKSMKYLCLALASMALFACSNEEEVLGVNNENTKSMYLKFEGLSAGTRAVGEAESEGAINLTNITVYFADASGVIQNTQTLDDEADDWSTISTTGHIFHNIPNSVEQVYVVGNAEGKVLPTVTAGTTNISAVKAQSMQVAAEQDFDDVILFGEDTEITPVTGDTPTDTEHPDGYLFEAEVTLAPFVARFEIAGIQCEDLTSEYKKIVLEAIGLMDYNNKFTLGGTASEEMTVDNVLEPGETAGQNEYVFGEASQNYDWAWDKINDGDGDAVLDADADVWFPASGTDRYVYQFCPIALKDGSLVQIKLAVNAYTDDTTIDPFGGVVTAKFQTEDGTDLTKFEAGKIYTIDEFKFKAENVGPWDPDETICVNVVVKVSEWDIVPLTPVFE